MHHLAVDRLWCDREVFVVVWEPESLVQRDPEPGALEALRLHALLVRGGEGAVLVTLPAEGPRGAAKGLKIIKITKITKLQKKLDQV
jgi:hypothetical protein